MLDYDGDDNSTGLGFLISSKPNSEFSDKDAEVISAKGNNGAFEYLLPLNAKYHKKYYRAYAVNGEGVSYGTSHRIIVPDSLLSMNWTDSAVLPDSPGWWGSPWLGEFYRIADSDWVFHEELGWIYLVVKNQLGGAWMWQEKLGWLWTNSEIYPFLYKGDSDQWLFSHGAGRGRLFCLIMRHGGGLRSSFDETCILYLAY